MITLLSTLCMDDLPDQGSMLIGLAGRKIAYKALGTPNPGFPSGTARPIPNPHEVISAVVCQSHPKRG